MLIVILLSLLEMICYFDTTWVQINKLKPPTLSLPVVELVYTGDGYIMSVGGRTINLF